MSKMPPAAKGFILGILVIGVELTAWMLLNMTWANAWVYALSVLGCAAQTLRVTDLDGRTPVNLAWLIYGFSFAAFGPAAAILVILLAHLAEWSWHRHPWHIQAFRAAALSLAVVLAGFLVGLLGGGAGTLAPGALLGILLALGIIPVGQRFLVGLLVSLVRKQPFQAGEIFRPSSLLPDVYGLGIGLLAVIAWHLHPLAALAGLLPLAFLYRELWVPEAELLWRRARRKWRKRGLHVAMRSSGD